MQREATLTSTQDKANLGAFCSLLEMKCKTWHVSSFILTCAHTSIEAYGASWLQIYCYIVSDNSYKLVPDNHGRG